MIYAPPARGILALDLSLTTGFAYGVWDHRPVFGHWNIGRMESSGEALAVLEDRIDEAIKRYKPRAVVYEAPIPARHSQNSSNTIELLMQLAGIAKLISVRHRLPYFHQECGQARKAVLGSSPRGTTEEIKPVIIAWAKRRGWDVKNQDDEADALLLLCYAIVWRDLQRKAHFNRHGDVL